MLLAKQPATLFAPTIKNMEEIGIRVCNCFLSFFSHKIRYHKESSESVELYIILQPFQSWFERFQTI